MKEFIQYLVETIAKNPADVSVNEVRLGETYLRMEVTVNPEDMGLVIGRNGRTIQSVRELAKAKAIKEGIKVDVELIEPDRGNRPNGKVVDGAIAEPTSASAEPAVIEATAEPVAVEADVEPAVAEATETTVEDDVDAEVEQMAADLEEAKYEADNTSEPEVTETTDDLL